MVPAELIRSAHSSKWEPLDFLFITVFAFTATVCTIFWWRGVLPFPFLGGDSALHAAYAAALSDPQAFEKDATLFQGSNFSFFRTLHLPLLLFLQRVFGDFGTGLMSILAPGIFIQMLGFYLLGRRLFGGKFPAFFLALASIGKLDLTVGYWGIIQYFQPRMFYQTLFPFLLLAFVNFGRNPAAWPWLLAVQGLLVWIHPPSAPTVALATLLGLFCYRPSSWTIGRYFKRSFFSGLTFLVVCSPFLFLFAGERPHGQTADYHEMISNYRIILGQHYLNAIPWSFWG